MTEGVDSSVDRAESDRCAAAAACRILRESYFFHIAFLLVVLAGLFAYCLHFEHRVVGTINFAMDDAWIHAAVARNLIEGKGWGIVPGRSLSVSTSPTWTLAVAVFLLFLRDPVVAVLSLSFLSMMAAVVLCYLLIRKLSGVPLLGVLGGVVMLFFPVVLWGMASGMELPLVLAVFLGTLLLYYSFEADSPVRKFWVPVALGISAVSRPELFFVIPLALLDTFCKLYLRGREGSLGKACSTLLWQAVIVLLTLSPYFLFNLWTSGLILPTTYYAKAPVRGVGISAALQSGSLKVVYGALVTAPVNDAFELGRVIWNSNPLLLLLLGLGAAAFCAPLATPAAARGHLIAAAMFLLPLAMGASTPSRYMSNHAHRYYVVFVPLAAALSCMAISLLVRFKQQRVWACLCAFLLLIAPWRTTYRAVQLLAVDCDSTERLYRQMPLWLKDNLDPNARLAVNDIGGIGYFAPRDFIDVMGLASPEIWPVIRRAPGQQLDVERLRQFLKDRRVEYLILSPRYYPALTKDSKVFRPVREWAERYEHGRTISPQILYKCHWD